GPRFGLAGHRRDEKQEQNDRDVSGACQQCAQSTSRTEQTGPNGAGLDRQPLTNFVVRQVFADAQLEEAPILARQPLYGRGNCPVTLLGVEQVDNTLSHGVMGAVGKLQVIERHTSRALVAAKLVKTQVGGQAIQPRTEGCLAVKLRQAQPCLEARLLDDIFGDAPANQAQCQAIYRVAVALDQLAERIAITGTRKPDQFI